MKDRSVMNRGKLKFMRGKYLGQTCKTPGCKRPAKLTGLCRRCYTINWQKERQKKNLPVE